MTFRPEFKKFIAGIALMLLGLVAGMGIMHFTQEPVKVVKKPPTELSRASRDLVESFMYKHRVSASYLTVLRFDFPKNTRVPIHRFFNDEDVKKVVLERLNGGDGALPIFIRDDVSNNNQIINLLHGEMDCSPFEAGGLSRVWPDLVQRFTVSCRVPIPPGFGGPTGYMVLHMKKPEQRAYEFEAMKIDLLGLAIALNYDFK